MVCYAHTFGAECHVSLSDTRMSDILDDMISSDLLSSDSRYMHVLYIGVTNLVLKQSKVFAIYQELREEGARTRNPGVTHVNDATV